MATDAEVDMQRAIVASVCVRAFTRLAAVPKIRRRRHVDVRLGSASDFFSSASIPKFL